MDWFDIGIGALLICWGLTLVLDKVKEIVIEAIEAQKKNNK